MCFFYIVFFILRPFYYTGMYMLVCMGFYMSYDNLIINKLEVCSLCILTLNTHFKSN